MYDDRGEDRNANLRSLAVAEFVHNHGLGMCCNPKSDFIYQEKRTLVLVEYAKC